MLKLLKCLLFSSSSLVIAGGKTHDGSMVNNVEIYSIPTGTVWYNLKQTWRCCFVVEFSLTQSFFS
jgi:hypothetical protein